MFRTAIHYGLFFAVALIGSVLLIIMIAGAGSTRTAAQAQDVCHAAMVFDRSGSVGSTNLETMRQQVLRLFQPMGIYNDNIQLAFWSFSSGNGRSNYDAPFNGYVSSRGVDDDFVTNMYRMVSQGNTNYEQGFGYHNGVVNPYNGMTDIFNQTNIIVFMTDGLPNVPGSGDNNQQARTAGRNAVLKHKAAGRIVIGGLIGSTSGSGLNYVINGSSSNSTDTFKISSNYSDLSTKLREIIGTRCDDLFPPEPAREYSLIPTVTSSDYVIEGAGSATFQYTVNNLSDTDTSDETGWTVKQVVVPPGQQVDNLTTGFKNQNGDPWQDNFSCTKLLELVNDKGSCEEIAGGSRKFGPGNSSMTLDVGSAGTLQLKDDWEPSTKVCRVLTIAKPTQNQAPTERYSRAVCVTIGKRPFVQVHGGDIMVGRYFVGDSVSEEDAERSEIRGITVTKSVEGQMRTFGSWAEYGAFAAGDIVGFASNSGLAKGALSEAQATWSKLTFANSNNEFGHFTEFNGAQGTIPDATSALLATHNVVDDLDDEDTKDFNGDVKSGIYRKQNGNLAIDASTLDKNTTVIVYVPEHSVRIIGDLKYNDGPYSAISEIPRLVIIAKNITMKETVGRVDAWLIANGSGEDAGTVSTCDEVVPGESSKVLTSQICEKPLTINGAIMARYLDLRRTGGAGRGGASGDPAEIINLSADTYLWTQHEGRSELRIQTTHTTELPPYF